MSFASSASSASSNPSSSGVNRKGKVLIPTLAVLAALILLLVIFTGFYTDFLWFKSMQNSSVFTTQLGLRIGLFFAFGTVMALAVFGAILLAYRTRPMSRVRSPEQLSLERYRAGLEPMRKPLAIAIPIMLGVLGGISAAAEWRSWAVWRNQVPFDATDPQFGSDISFYMFSYPWLRFILGFAFAILVLALIANAIVHYIYGGLRLQPPSPRVSAAAQIQISILLGIFCILKAVAYWLDRYGLALKSEDLVQGFTGLKYRDINALLPAKSILIVIALICAVLFFVNAFSRSWFVAGAGLGLLVVSALVIGGIYPAIVQQFQVKPSELTKEEESIQNNIDATRDAYSLNDIEVNEYNAVRTPDKNIVSTQTGTLESVRLVDPLVVSPTFRALQQNFGFYSFPDTLDIDRYMLEGKERGAVVSIRDLNLDGVPAGQRNWANDHLVYTHGFGFVAAFDNAKTPSGEPVFFEQGIPPEGLLTIDQPRAYYGEDSPDYSIVGGGPDTTPRELDYPDDAAPNGQRKNTYDGTGGVPVGSTIDRLLFAIKYQEPNIMLSSLINEESRIIWDRDPRVVVNKVAPWLQLDSDPYPIVVDGRMKWIVDGYTTSNSYPFSSRVSLSDAITDSAVIRTGPGTIGPRDDINYIRNSVKATVDAYDGTVNLYEWDEADPVLKTWRNVFPDVIQPKAELPAGVLEHVRYPEDGFKVQRMLFSRYHVTDPAAFYSGQDFWNVPIDPTQSQENSLQPPYYLSLQMPGQDAPKFSLTTTYAPVNRQTLAAFMSVDSSPGENFGNIVALKLPRNSTIPGPVQVQNAFDSNAEIANEINILRRGGTEVQLGNLLSLPVGGGILYVEPLYVKAAQNGYPLLQKILVSFGDKTVMRDNLPEALRDVGVIPADGSNTGKDDKNNGEKLVETEQTLLRQLAAQIALAQAAFNEGQVALQNNDFAAYGEAQKRLENALRRAQEIEKQIADLPAGATVAPSADPVPEEPAVENASSATDAADVSGAALVRDSLLGN
ncbi:MAG: uncharacterized membrane protein (UPF0182 family) [Actinomycetes bacterium]